MTCSRAHCRTGRHDLDGAVASHSAELVRGEVLLGGERPPHPPVSPKASLRLDGHLLPKGRRVYAISVGEEVAGRR